MTSQVEPHPATEHIPKLKIIKKAEMIGNAAPPEAPPSAPEAVAGEILENQRYQEEMRSVINEECWLMHRCIEGALEILKKASSSISDLNFFGPDTDHTPQILRSQSVFVIATKMYEEIKRDLRNPDTAEPSGDEG